MATTKINSKNKGSEFERTVAKRLSYWSGHEFNRTPSSGGLRWKEDNSVVGDIVPPPDLNFPFSIEAKKQEIPWDFDFILKQTSEIWKFWEQSYDDCIRMEENTGVQKYPMVVMSKNRRNIYALTYWGLVSGWLESRQIPHIHIVHKFKENPINLVIFDFDAFLNNVSLDEVLHNITLKIPNK